MPRKTHEETIFPGINEQHQEVLRELRRINKRLDKLMADAASILAKVTANTNTLKSIQAGVTAAAEGHTTIAEEIQALKDQIAAGQAPDFGPLDAATDEQTTLLGGLAAAIPANTSVG